MLAVLVADTPSRTQEEPAGPKAEAAAAATGSPDALHSGLRDGVKARHEQHYFDTAKRMAQELSAADLVRLLETAAEELKMAEAEEDWDRAWAVGDARDAVAWALVQQGPPALQAALGRVAELGITLSEDEDLAYMAAWIAMSYPTRQQLQEAKALVRECPAVWALYTDEDEGNFRPSDFDAPVQAGIEWDWPYTRPLPFSRLQAALDALPNTKEEGAGWFLPEDRLLDVPWAENPYNPANWKVTASSAASGHSAVACVDGKVSTFWCPEESDTHPWIRFEAPERLTFFYYGGVASRICIVPGAATDLRAFLAYGRPTCIRVEYGDGTYSNRPIEYGTAGQSRTYLFPPPLKWDHVADWLTIRILEWESGQQHLAPAISEIATDGSWGFGGDGITPIALE